MEIIKIIVSNLDEHVKLKVNLMNLQKKIIQQIDAKINAHEIVSQINDDGVAVIPKLLSDEAIECLNSEFSNAYTNTYKGILAGKHAPGKIRWCNPKLMNKNEFPAVEAVFTNSIFKKISKEIILGNKEGKDFEFHNKIAFTHEFKQTTITDVHFDSIRTLKFFIYLVNVDESNGAFRIAKGTHLENNAYREKFLKRDGKLMDILNVPGSNEKIELKSICAPAGTLIIFDTDTFHQGGALEVGKERKVMRASSTFLGQTEVKKRKKLSKTLSKVKKVILPLKTPKGYELRTSTKGNAKAK